MRINAIRASSQAKRFPTHDLHHKLQAAAAWMGCVARNTWNAHPHCVDACSELRYVGLDRAVAAHLAPSPKGMKACAAACMGAFVTCRGHQDHPVSLGVLAHARKPLLQVTSRDDITNGRGLRCAPSSGPRWRPRARRQSSARGCTRPPCSRRPGRGGCRRWTPAEDRHTPMTRSG